MIITYSQFKTYKYCQQKYFYNYVELLSPKKKPKALFVGTIIHNALDVYYSNNFNEELAIQQIEAETKQNILELENRGLCQDLIDETINNKELCINILKNYFKHYKEDKDKYEPIKTEFIFSGKIKTKKNKYAIRKTEYQGKCDGIWRDKKTGKTYLIEHKTAVNWDEDINRLLLDEQTAIYKYFIEQLGIKIDGILFNIMLKKYPKEPKLLKSGKLSIDKNQNTDYDNFINAIRKYNLKEEDYTEMLIFLKENGKKYLYREFIDFNDKELSLITNELYNVVKEIKNKVRYKKPFYRNASDMCVKFCPYYILCIERNNKELYSIFEKRENLNPELEENIEEKNIL